MKTYKSLSPVLLAVLLLMESFLYSACDGDGEPKTARQSALEKLTAKTWKIKSVTADGADVTSKFAGMSITFTETTFTVSNGSTMWPATDVWSFVNDEAVSIKRGDNVQVEIAALTASSLTLTLQWSKNAFGPGRERSVTGNYTFIFE
ncbi:hypothetical protein KK083_31390 [Fulvivirgaceae bacterium PWU4]|uniref:Lipocalin-like domain-containing protein n=1 Tax=Chryseosolibacter histidini TaxID=2782349 RepID=A0AAP2GSP7_9BACT|nr:hypothetical protein [Chryseosolibacter histidini]MBT1701440.1 hypothetical protein [Chryseosolibacter histidini]